MPQAPIDKGNAPAKCSGMSRCDAIFLGTYRSADALVLTARASCYSPGLTRSFKIFRPATP